MKTTVNDIIELNTDSNTLVIEKAENKKIYKTIQERFEGFTGEYEPLKIDWGKSVGNEIW